MKYITFSRSATLIRNRLIKIKEQVSALSEQENLTTVQHQTLLAYLSEAKLKKADFDKILIKLLDTASLPSDYSEEAVATVQDEISELCISIESTIKTLIPHIEEDSVVHNEEVQAEHTLSMVRLPKLELRHFDGDPITWVSFINLFDSTIHRNASLPGVAKFQYLLSVLSGEPLSLIKSLNISAANYQVAYDILRERYHSPRRLLTLHLNKILDLPAIAANSTKQMRHFLNLFNEHTQALKALACDITANNPLFSALTLRKMDNELRKRLENFRSTHDEGDPHSLPRITDIVKFINEECVHAEDAGLHNSAEPHRSHSSSFDSANTSHKFIGTRSPQPKKMITRKISLLSTSTSNGANFSERSQIGQSHACFVCKQMNHKVYDCSLFKSKTPQERYKIVKDNHRCVSCLGHHDFKECKSKVTCFTCRKRHHSSLHFDFNEKGQPLASQKDSQKESSPNLPQGKFAGISTQVNFTPTHSTVLLGTTLVKLTSENGTTHVFRALIDSCSMCDFLSERAAQLLGVQRYKSTHAIDGISETPTNTKGFAYVNIDTLNGQSVSVHHPILILNKITSDLPRSEISPEVLERVKPYLLADPSFYLPSGIDVLLGGEIFPKVITGEKYTLGPNMPFVLGTCFGFIVMGQTPCLSTQPSMPRHSTTLLTVTDIDLHNSLQQFWQQEEPPVFSNKSEEEKLCDEYFSTTHSRDDNGRYVVRLPFKPDHPQLGNTLTSASTRFKSLEHKFRTNAQFKDMYIDFMRDYHDAGHMVKADDPCILQSPHCFLPHHGVLKGSSSTTKLRTVFDASCKSSNGISLNETLLTGKKLHTNICDIILNFRSYNYVFSCDIRQMYRQIKIHPDDQNFQLILWREDEAHPLSTYKLTTVTYGMNSSPYLAIRTLSQLAEDDGHLFPEAAEVLKSHTYVDDIIAGADTEEKALHLQCQLVSLLKRGCFELRKWTSNSAKLLTNFPKEHHESPVFLNASQQPHFSVLGLFWSPNTDTFSYNFHFPTSSTCTKRHILSVVSKIYDPCGFLSPIVMWAKCFIQLLWTKRLLWDEPLPKELTQKWETFVADSKAIMNIQIPRPFHFSNSSPIELHGFSDASECGYAAVVYFRCNQPDGDFIIQQVMAKTRVAPLKRVSLPRLELCASHLLAQLVSYCLSILSHRFRIITHLWCDSTIVLTWLQTPPYRLKTYVANRVSQVQELIPSHNWSYVKSSENPADCASRGLLPSQLTNHHLWWQGPPWLKLSSCEWPTPRFVPIDISSSEETKQTPLSVLVCSPCEEWDLLSKYSSWTKLQRVMAYILRFVYNSTHSQKKMGFLSTEELTQAQLRIFKLLQASNFKEDISLLQNHRPCSTRLQRLSPFLDSDNILRVGGRIDKSRLSYDARHAVILPKSHHIVNILINHYHVMYLHAGPQLTQSLLSQKVWILSGRSVIRSCIHKCITCFRNKPQNKMPLMGDLPTARVTSARPFLRSGVDIGGPFTAKVHNLRSIRHVKIYICIFVCFSTKAVHIETVTDLSTDTFIAALTRFVSRRGLCSDLYSDCGTNFIGANNVLKTTVKSLFRNQDSQARIFDFCSQRSITFHFNPPAAPHQGGLWESAIKGAKHHLRRVLGGHILTLFEFSTLTTQVEAILNSRPLTPLSNDPADPSALTPGHFLIGSPLVALPEPNLEEAPLDRLKHWHLVQALHQRIWRRWHVEYLHCLQQRNKWTTKTENLKVGDLVVVHTPNAAPLQWPLARILSVSPGADNIVRVVQLKTKTGIISRPVAKIFPLPVN